MKNKKIELLDSDTVRDADLRIAHEIGSMVFQENRKLLTELAVTEIEQSLLSVDELAEFIREKTSILVSFAKEFFRGQSPKFLSPGVSITYAIYMIYLLRNNEQALLSFLKRRGIPNEERFLMKLNKIKKVLES